METSSGRNDSEECGTCLAIKSGKPLVFGDTSVTMVDNTYVDKKKNGLKSQQLDSYEAEKKNYFWINMKV